MTITVYNEQVKLTASLVNLMAVGLITAGVTTPLVGAFYGAQIFGGTPMLVVAAGGVVWLAMALMLHLAALFLLRSLME